MPVYYKGQRMPWYIPGIDSRKSINLDPRTFTPEMLPGNEIRQGGDNLPFVKIPRIPGRISQRKDGYIELILSHSYNKEAGQSRNKKVIIGSDISSLLPGMMAANDRYYEYFNSHGTLINDPMKEEKAQAEAQPLQSKEGQAEIQENQHKENRITTHQNPTETQQNRTEAQITHPETKPQRQNSSINKAIQQQTALEPTEDTATEPIKDETLKQKEKELKNLEIRIKQREKELQKLDEEYESLQEELSFVQDDAQKEHIRLLSYMLDHFMETIKVQANRKPDAPMTQKQVQTINGILAELQSFFSSSETGDYLRLAEEPDENTPGITNGEMTLLLGIYHHTASAYLYGDLRAKQKT